jgi:hypothetical protein
VISNSIRPLNVSVILTDVPPSLAEMVRVQPSPSSSTVAVSLALWLVVRLPELVRPAGLSRSPEPVVRASGFSFCDGPSATAVSVALAVLASFGSAEFCSARDQGTKTRRPSIVSAGNHHGRRLELIEIIFIAVSLSRNVPYAPETPTATAAERAALTVEISSTNSAYSASGSRPRVIASSSLASSQASSYLRPASQTSG